MAAKTKKLVIVESPAKAKTISRFLGGEYVVEASFGHVRDLPEKASEMPEDLKKQKWACLGVRVDDGFEPVYIVPADKKKHVGRLRQAAKDAGSLLLATDEDREGESISWHVLQVLKPNKQTEVRRIVFHEVTKEAIQQALRHPRQLNQSLVRAQEARRILDRLYGYTLSPLLWKKIVPGLSAGRVQSVAVRLTVERERQRKAFIAATYWDVEAELKAKDGSFVSRLVRLQGSPIADGKSFDPLTGKPKSDRQRILSEQEALELAEAAKKAKPWLVTDLKRTPATQSPAPPFTTSTLQQEANRKLRFTARRTMQVAQQLYEGVDLDGERVGLITYMRTDSLALAERAIQQAREVIAEAYGSEYRPPEPKRYKTKSKRAQEAHEAIRPTDLSRKPQDVRKYLDNDQHRLYELIWKRTIACQMVPARILRTSVEVTVQAAGNELVFYASGKEIQFPGYLRAYVEGSDDPEAELGDKEIILPAMEQGQAVEPLRVEPQGHTTKPPARYTEASLVKKLEEEGIGRPSTYATIIGTIEDRGYIFKRANELIPTFTAFCVTELLEKHFGDLVDLAFTARMEDELDDVASGKLDWSEPLKEFYYGSKNSPGLATRVEHEGPQLPFPQIEIGKSPDTGEPVVVKIGKYGPYLLRGQGGNGNVAGIPDDLPPADLTLEEALRMLDAKPEEPATVGQEPHTGRAIMLRTGRYGSYLEVADSHGEGADGAKPKRVTLPQDLKAEDLTPEVAERLASLPKLLGPHPVSGQEVTTGIGRYGPYVKHGSEFRSLTSWEQACDLSLDEAVEILAQPKTRRRSGSKGPAKVLKEFGQLEGSAGPVKIVDGRYGPYVTDGKTNATLPKGTPPESLTAEEASELLAKKAAAGPGRPFRRRGPSRKQKSS